MSERDKKKKKKKRSKSILENEINRIIYLSMKTAMDEALRDIEKDWNSKATSTNIDIPLRF